MQLPPALHHNLKRRIIERFKKSLFSQQSNPCNLKSEIKKVQYSTYRNSSFTNKNTSYELNFILPSLNPLLNSALY